MIINAITHTIDGKCILPQARVWMIFWEILLLFIFPEYWFPVWRQYTTSIYPLRRSGASSQTEKITHHKQVVTENRTVTVRIWSISPCPGDIFSNCKIFIRVTPEGSFLLFPTGRWHQHYKRMQLSFHITRCEREVSQDRGKVLTGKMLNLKAFLRHEIQQNSQYWAELLPTLSTLII